MNLTYEFSEEEFSQDGLSNFQMFFGFERLKEIVAVNPTAGNRLCGALEILRAASVKEAPLHESQWISDLSWQLFEDTPIAFLAAPSAPITSAIFWTTYSAHADLKYFELDGGGILYVSNRLRRSEHLQRFHTKIFEIGATLGVPENVCEEHYENFLTGVMHLAAMDEN